MENLKDDVMLNVLQGGNLHDAQHAFGEHMWNQTDLIRATNCYSGEVDRGFNLDAISLEVFKVFH